MAAAYIAERIYNGITLVQAKPRVTFAVGGSAVRLTTQRQRAINTRQTGTVAQLQTARYDFAVNSAGSRGILPI